MNPVYYVAFDSSIILRVYNEDGTWWAKRAERYTTFDQFMPDDAMKEAVSVVVNDNGIMHWLKQDGHFIGQRELTVDENHKLLLQLLRSEEWKHHLGQI